MKKWTGLCLIGISAILLTACAGADEQVEKGLAAIEVQDYTTAVQELEKAPEMKKWYDKTEDADIQLYLAQAYMGSGAYDKAEAVYNELLQTDAANAELYKSCGLARMAQNKWDDAVQSFEKAMESGLPAEDAGQCSVYCGKAMFEKGDYTAAEQYFQNALAQSAGDSSLYLQIGQCRMKLGDYNGALAIFEEGVQKGDVSCLQSLLYHQVICYEALGDYETAKQRMGEYVQQYPDDEEAAREYEFLQTR